MALTKKNILLGNLGLDVSAPAEYIDDRATPNGQNMSINRNILIKRCGTTALGTSLGEEVMFITELLREGVRYVVRIGLTKIELLNQSNSTWASICPVLSPLTGTTNDAVSVATPLLSSERILCITNLVDNIRKYTGTGNTSDLGGTPPKAKYMVAYGSYLVLAYVDDGAYTRTMRVQWCDTGDCESWTLGTGVGNAGAIDLLEDGNDITGLNIFGNYLCVHKEGCIYLGYLVTTANVFQFDRKATGVGTICNNTIQNIGDSTQIFLARDGIRIFNGISAPLITSPISDELRESMNPKYIHKCWSIVVPELNEYWVGIAIGSQTSPDTVYKYNYVTGQCYKDLRAGVTAIGVFQKTTGSTWDNDSGTWDEATDRWDDYALSELNKTILLGDNLGNTTKVDNSVNNDNSIAITAFRDTKDFQVDGDKGRLARWLGMEIIAKGGSLTLSYSTNSGVNWITVETFALSSDFPSDDNPVMAYFDVVSSKIRFRFENSVLGETFALKDFIISYATREVRK